MIVIQQKRVMSRLLVVYNYSSRQSQNRQISLENKRSLKQSPRLKNAYVSFDKFSIFWSVIRSQIFFFSFISLAVYFLRQMIIFLGGEFIRWPTKLSYAGVCVLRLAFNLLQIKFLDNKRCGESNTSTAIFSNPSK